MRRDTHVVPNSNERVRRTTSRTKLFFFLFPLGPSSQGKNLRERIYGVSDGKSGGDNVSPDVFDLLLLELT